jgi:hypothetical protein
LLCGEDCGQEARVLAHGVKALEESVFGPCTPHGKPGQVGRTWGTRPEPMTAVGRSNPPELADLMWTSLKPAEGGQTKRAPMFGRSLPLVIGLRFVLSPSAPSAFGNSGLTKDSK